MTRLLVSISFVFCVVSSMPSALAAPTHSASALSGAETTNALPVQPKLSALSVLVLDEKTGSPLIIKNADMETPIASISKLMTAMVILDAKQDMQEKIAVTNEDVDMLRHSSSRLAVGTVLTRGQLLHLALIASENRAAHALARHYPGGLGACIQAMNQKAKTLGMQNTTFEDPTGLTSHNQSTAEDLAKMVKAAYAYPTIHEITTTAHYQITHTTLSRIRERIRSHKLRHHKRQSTHIVWRSITREVAFNNTNQLVREGRWDIGLSKTGFINEAGHCLVMQANIARHKVIIVLLDAAGKYDRIRDAQRIRQWMESHLTNDKVASAADYLP